MRQTAWAPGSGASLRRGTSLIRLWHSRGGVGARIAFVAKGLPQKESRLLLPCIPLVKNFLWNSMTGFFKFGAIDSSTLPSPSWDLSSCCRCDCTCSTVSKRRPSRSVLWPSVVPGLLLERPEGGAPNNRGSQPGQQFPDNSWFYDGFWWCFLCFCLLDF